MSDLIFENEWCHITDHSIREECHSHYKWVIKEEDIHTDDMMYEMESGVMDNLRMVSNDFELDGYFEDVDFTELERLIKKYSKDVINNNRIGVQ
jgi:hypothetical protein